MSPLPGPGLHARVSGGGLREGPGHGHRQAPRRSVLRLPVLHAGLSLRGAEVQPFQGHRPQVRHVQRPARRRRSPGLRAVVPERRHRDPRGRRRADRRGIRDPPVRAGRAGAGPDVADHGLPDRASAPAQHGAGGLPHGAARAGALAADPDAGPHAALGRGVPRGTAAGAARSGGADGEHPPGAQRQRAGVRPARARGQRAAPRPPALRLPGRPGPAALVAQPRDPGLRHLCRTGRDLCRLVLGGIGGLAGTTRD